MSFFELFLIAVGLSMDAFAVAVCKGLSMQRFQKGRALVIALFFGAFQALMPLLGWFLGSRFAAYIQRYDHWIAFFLLLWIGISMIRESRGGDGEAVADGAEEQRLELKELLMLSIATSIDALAVGVTFAFLEVPILPAVSLIGVTTLVLSFIGVAVGNYFGSRYKSRAELLGGVILIAIGSKILLEHLGILT